MSIHLPVPDIGTPAPAAGGRQRGFGLLQAMLVLMLLGAVVAAAALMLQSGRPLEQAANQQEQLRWADEALMAYAAAHSRLPCPARNWSEDPVKGAEDCALSSGFLPIARLPGANEQALAAGPVRYTASQGTQRSIAGAPMVFPSLREPGDAYLIPDAYGEPLEEAAPAGPPALFGTTGSTPAVVGNGLDFCAALHRNSLSQGDASAANTVDAAGARYNIAYGLTAAGTQPGRHGRFDSADSIALPSPAQPGDADYDDRVRVRTFESMAHSLGCRQFADTTSPDQAPPSVGIMAMDALAGAVAIHTTIGELQENNIGNGELGVIDATFTQATTIAAIALNVGGIYDALSSTYLSAGELVRAVATCIASLGITCWEVAFKITALVTAVVSAVSGTVALGLNTAALIPVGMALDASVKARDRARRAVKPQAQSVEDVLKQLEVTLFGAMVETCEYKLGADHFPIPVMKDGKVVFDENGQPVYECLSKKTEFQDGLKQQVDKARAEENRTLAVENAYYTHRISPFNERTIEPYRINVGASDARYQEWRCEATGGGSLNSSCTLPASGENAGYSWKVYLKPSAKVDALKRLRLAEQWSDAKRYVEEMTDAVDELKKQKDSFATLLQMARDDASKICGKATSQEDKIRCDNSNNQVRYLDTCQSTQYENGKLTVVDEMQKNPRDYNLQCKPMIAANLARAESELKTYQALLKTIRKAYDDQPSPYIEYPKQWVFEKMLIEEDTGAYTWCGYQNRSAACTRAGKDSSSEKRTRYYDDFSQESGKRGMPLLDPAPSFICMISGGCRYYTYAQAYSDWQRSRAQSEQATTNRENLQARYNDLRQKYEDLKAAQTAIGSGQESPIVIGAGNLILKADQRGAVGPLAPAGAGR
ncbi:hypothetical protein ARC78_03710 [Stenotrophomonas pictorum JCM 9942]|uniref:Uncharacterized protein n=3 Tax=Stenotrophomonas pictorum TaxID=86184 RepID=A0A0R0AIT2_9GAMM|nr:hypothetical protein [Stenotrophomonas pictorum]KRG44927.1 hypothetical protein ARC78_03710 [Stenotrophomonas pictorum JCM 9942]